MANPSSFTLNTGTNALMLKALDMMFRASAAISPAEAKLRLSNTAPSATDTYSIVTTNEISGNGYATITPALNAAVYDGGQTRFECTLSSVPLIIASGGSIVFQYAYLTVGNAHVWGHWSWASAETVTSGSTYEFSTLSLNSAAQGVTVNS